MELVAPALKGGQRGQLGDALQEGLLGGGGALVEDGEQTAVETALRVEPLEEVIDDMVLQLRDNHTERLRRGICTVNGGLVFLETLTYLERASDQCSSIAVMMLARNNENILQNHYDYLREIHAGNDAAYSAEKERRREQYIKPLKETH